MNTMKTLAALAALTTLAGCASAPFTTSGWKPGDKPSWVDVQNAGMEITMGTRMGSLGMTNIPLDAQTKSGVDQLTKMPYNQLIALPPQGNEHAQALVQAEINSRASVEADYARRENLCAQSGLGLGCLDNYN
jgi:type IV pilus biogenesis protein CpaD/CtpE